MSHRSAADRPDESRSTSVSGGEAAHLWGPSFYQTTIGDLIRRAIINSDCAATDILIARLGGTLAVESVLNQKRASDVRIDRDERHLQTEIVGPFWRPEYVDAAVLDRGIASVPE